MNEIEKQSAAPLAPAEMTPERPAPVQNFDPRIVHETHLREIPTLGIPPVPVAMPAVPGPVAQMEQQPTHPNPAPNGMTMPNITIVNHNVQPAAGQPVMFVEHKSMGLAMVLTLFFGPLGMIYSTVTGAIVMFILDLVIAVPTGGLALIILWPIQLIWTYSGIKNHNSKFYMRAA